MWHAARRTLLFFFCGANLIFVATQLEFIGKAQLNRVERRSLRIKVLGDLRSNKLMGPFDFKVPFLTGSFHEASCYGNLWVKVIWKDGFFLPTKTFGQNLCKSFNLYFLGSFKGLGTMTLICLLFIAQVASGINFLRFVIRMGGGAEACGHSVAGKLDGWDSSMQLAQHDGKKWFGHSNLSLSVSAEADAGCFPSFLLTKLLPTPLALSCLVLRCELEAYSAQQRDCEMLQSKDLGLVVIYMYLCCCR